MKEFSDNLRAFELEHLWLNMFNSFRKCVCIFTLHVTKKFSFNILKTVSLKIEKKTSIEAQSEGPARVHKISESHLADWRKRIQKRCAIGSEIFRRLQSSCTWKNCMVNQGECYSHTLAPNPEMKAVSYAGKTFGRCSVIFFKVAVACSFWVARVITRRKSFEFNWPEVRLKEKYIAWSISRRVPYNKLPD